MQFKFVFKNQYQYQGKSMFKQGPSHIDPI